MANVSLSVLYFLTLCCLWGAWLRHNTVAQQDGCRRVQFISPENGYYFKNHLLLNLSIGIYASCEHRCVMESECVSVNVGPPINNKVTCELSNYDHWHHPGDLQPRHGWTYRGTRVRVVDLKNPCSSNPCHKNAKCLLGYTDKRYLCVCSSGYTGEYCQTDIDECSDESHDCHQNATCENTAGHFNCTCKPGFTGDGRNCSDIDECSDESHDCHQNATCENIAGHFNCTCKPGFTGDGRNCSDCSGMLLKYQDLPTKGAYAVKHFTINGSPFLAFANFRSDNGGHKTDSFIYKLNDSTRKFSLYQTIGTIGACDVEYFKIADKHYLAVANYNDGISYRQNSVIYQWDHDHFVVFQKLETFGATSFKFFKIMEEQFLAISNYRNDSSHYINSVIFKWNSSKFEQIQQIPTEGAVRIVAFVINNETFIALANYYTTQQHHSVQSTVFKWSGQQFVKLQSFPLSETSGARDVQSFNYNGSAFLSFAIQYRQGTGYNTYSSIYKWNGSYFALWQRIPTRGASGWHPFLMCSQTFLGVANHYDDNKGYNTVSVIYRASQEQFIEYQEISTRGAFDMTSFQFKGHTYLVVANIKDNAGKFNIHSTLYKWSVKTA